MQNQSKIFIIIILSVLIFVPFLVNARSGCCSHHGGVCGCGCCDGTSLSATCAPYYPQCNSDSVATGNNSGETANTGDNSSTWWILGILVVGGLGIYYYNKNKNKK